MQHTLPIRAPAWAAASGSFPVCPALPLISSVQRDQPTRTPRLTARPWSGRRQPTEAPPSPTPSVLSAQPTHLLQPWGRSRTSAVGAAAVGATRRSLQTGSALLSPPAMRPIWTPGSAARALVILALLAASAAAARLPPAAAATRAAATAPGRRLAQCSTQCPADQGEWPADESYYHSLATPTVQPQFGGSRNSGIHPPTHPPTPRVRSHCGRHMLCSGQVQAGRHPERTILVMLERGA